MVCQLTSLFTETELFFTCSVLFAVPRHARTESQEVVELFSYFFLTLHLIVLAKSHRSIRNKIQCVIAKLANNY